MLNVVRQWDQTAAAVTNTKAIGAYNWMGLGSSEIVYLNNTEYWVSPTTPDLSRPRTGSASTSSTPTPPRSS